MRVLVDLTTFENYVLYEILLLRNAYHVSQLLHSRLRIECHNNQECVDPTTALLYPFRGI